MAQTDLNNILKVKINAVTKINCIFHYVFYKHIDKSHVIIQLTPINLAIKLTLI